MAIVSQEEQQVKPDVLDGEADLTAPDLYFEAGYIFGDLPKCSYDGCHEPVFRSGVCCWDHFIEEETIEWDNQDAERETCLAGVGR